MAVHKENVCFWISLVICSSILVSNQVTGEQSPDQALKPNSLDSLPVAGNAQNNGASDVAQYDKDGHGGKDKDHDHKDKDKHDDDDDCDEDDIEWWVILLCVLGGITGLLFLILTLYCCCRTKTAPQSAGKNSRTNSTVKIAPYDGTPPGEPPQNLKVYAVNIQTPSAPPPYGEVEKEPPMYSIV